MSRYSDVAAEYDRNLASSKGQAYLKELGIGSAAAFAAWHYSNYGQGEGRTPYANGGIFSNGVVSQPTTFHNSMMGEAGPEAIMPLVQTQNGLAVRAVGPGSDSGSVAEIRALREETRMLRLELQRSARANEETAKLLRNVTRGGEAMLTEAA